MALITLAVFSTLQDYGPESAIRRFHAAIASDDGPELQQVTEQSIQAPQVRYLATWVRLLQQQGYRYQLMRMDRSPTQVRAAVVYTAGNIVRPMIWVVEKKGHTWKVDAVKTDTILRDSLGFDFNEY